MRAHGQSSLSALYKVFVAPTLQQAYKPFTRSCARGLGTIRPTNHLPRHIILATRTPSCPFSTSIRTQAKSRPPEARTQLWNEEIPARWIRLVDGSTGQLEEQAQSLRSVLQSIDQKTHRLVLLSPPQTEAEKTSAVRAEWIPTCKIVSKKEQYERDKAKKEAKKPNLASTMKTLEINWAIDENDLGHRLGKAKEFLEEGRKVEVILAKKKRGRVAAPEECQEVLRRIKELVAGVQGARQIKEMEGKVGGVATIMLERVKK